MKKIIVNGKEIKTNIHNANYPRLKDSMNVKPVPFGMSEEKFLEQLVEEGYTTITFYYMTTRVKGYHNTYANCR